MSKEKVLQWVPSVASELLAVVFCIIYAATDGAKPLMYLELLGAGLAPLIVPVYGVISKKNLSWGLSAAIAAFVFFACDIGTSLDFYNKYYCWDLIMHGVFGFLCSLVIFTLMVRWNGTKMNPVGFLIIIFVFTMGVAALWEVIEYTMDLITGDDAQHVMESIALGKSPVADTMEDIIIAMAGVAVFYITLLIDKFNKYRFYSHVSDFNGFQAEKSEVISYD